MHLFHGWRPWTEHAASNEAIVQKRSCRKCEILQVRTVRIKHVHDWDEWGEPRKGTSWFLGSYSDVFTQTRYCKTCSQMGARVIDPRYL